MRSTEINAEGRRGRGRLALRVLALFAVCGPAAYADVIHYKDGRALEGRIVSRSATELTVQTDFGTIKVPLSKVASIEEKLTPAEELDARRAQLAQLDVAGRFELALWAGDHGLANDRRALLREVLALDPGHALANEALGRVLIDGEWLDADKLAEYRQAHEAEKLAQGLLWDNDSWQPEAEVMARRGFTRFHGEWLPRRQGETAGLVEELAAADIPLQAVSGEFVTIFSDLPADAADALASAADEVVRDLLLRWTPTDDERAPLLEYDIPVLLLPDLDALARCMDSGCLDRYGASAGFKARFRGAKGFSLYWPRPLIGLVANGEHMELAGDPHLGRLGFISHQLAHVLVQRWKGELSAPPWVEAGMAALYEGLTTQYGTITITSFTRDADNQPRDPFVPHWENFVQWNENLHSPTLLASCELRTVTGQSLADLDSREIGIAWSLLLFLHEKHRTELVEYVRAWGAGRDTEGKLPPELHELAWKASFADPLARIQDRWRAWARDRPGILLPERLLGSRR